MKVKGRGVYVGIIAGYERKCVEKSIGERIRCLLSRTASVAVLLSKHRGVLIFIRYGYLTISMPFCSN
jgi:hypothetical protein